MPPETTGPMGLDAPRPPDDGWPGDEPPDAPDPDWPDDWPDDDQADAPWLASAPAGRSAGARPGPRPLVLVIVAVVALAAGAGVALAVTRAQPSAPSAASSRPPPTAAPGGSGGVLPGAGGGSAATQIFVGGEVRAVSGTSITIGGPGRSVTAAVTSSTRVTGRVSSIRSVKVGDLVTAQLTESDGRTTVTAIQDPGSLPTGGSLP
jgi:hypothetical protein